MTFEAPLSMEFKWENTNSPYITYFASFDPIEKEKYVEESFYK